MSQLQKRIPTGVHFGCVCRPDRNRIVSRFEWIPNGNDPDFKHCIVEKTKRNIMQGKVRR